LTDGGKIGEEIGKYIVLANIEEEIKVEEREEKWENKVMIERM
jgi:hypothetical protein